MAKFESLERLNFTSKDALSPEGKLALGEMMSTKEGMKVNPPELAKEAKELYEAKQRSNEAGKGQEAGKEQPAAQEQTAGTEQASVDYSKMVPEGLRNKIVASTQLKDDGRGGHETKEPPSVRGNDAPSRGGAVSMA